MILTITAGLETMRQMTPAAYARLDAMGHAIREKLTRMLHDRGTPATVCGRGSLFLAHLTAGELVDFRSLSGYSRSNPMYQDLCHEMLANGIVTSPRGVFGCLSTPMTEADLDAFVDALQQSLSRIGIPSCP